MSKPKTHSKVKAVIIGAGRIGAGFDAPKDAMVLTHAHAYTAHPETTLAGIFDIDVTRSRAAAKKWTTTSYDDLEGMMREVRPDIVSITTPDETHLSLITRIATYKPKLIFAEKPIVQTAKEASLLQHLLQKESIPILVNYTRRFDATMCAVRDALTSGRYGSVLGAQGIYTKGLLHNGSHLIDLCHFLFGALRQAHVTYGIDDYRHDEPSIGGMLAFERCPQFSLMIGDARTYAIFELDIFCERQRLRFYDFGYQLSTQDVIADPLMPGEFLLDNARSQKTAFDRALSVAVDNAVQHISHGMPLISDATSALETHNTCLRLSDLYAKGYKKK